MHRSMTISEKIAFSILFIFIVLLSFLAIYPLFWLFMSGVKDNAGIFLNSVALPKVFLINNYAKAWNAGVSQYFLNSIIVTSIAVSCTIFIAVLAAFPLSRMEFKGKTVISTIIVGGLILSPQVVILPLYRIFKMVGIYNTYAALVVPYVTFGIPMAIFLLRTYFLTIPRAMEESATIDGAKSFGVLTNIIVPLGMPMIASCALLSTLSCWNEYLFALVLLEDSSLRTIPVGIANLQSQLSTDYGVLLAGLAISTVPMIVFFLIFQKQFIRGLTAGSVKG